MTVKEAPLQILAHYAPFSDGLHFWCCEPDVTELLSSALYIIIIVCYEGLNLMKVYMLDC